MKFNRWLFEAETKGVNRISFAEKEAKGMFGPVYHGTTEDNRSKINNQGFQVNFNIPSKGENGYQLAVYSGTKFPPPIHHLGFGVYFTTIKNIAKMFNIGSGKGLIDYYLDVPRLETINFASQSKMMDWWFKNGYNINNSDFSNVDQMQKDRFEATMNLTNSLKSKYDAVWFKGKGLTRLLDGDQICVFDPKRIYVIDRSLDDPDALVPGDRFIIKGTNHTATYLGFPHKLGTLNPFQFLGNSNEAIQVKFTNKLTPNLLKSIYSNEVKNYILKTKDQYNISNFENFDTFLDHRVNYTFDNRSLSLNFPKLLIDRVLKKGERVK